jgi:hypothetical protein
VVDTPVRREGIPILDNLNNEDNISRPARRMSNSEPANDGSNNNIFKNNQFNNNSSKNNELNNNNSYNNEFNNNNNNNESYNNIPARRMSVSGMLNNEDNVSRPARTMSVSGMLNNEDNVSRPARTMSVSGMLNNENNISRPSSRMSDYDPTNKNIKSFLGFSFGVDYSHYLESFINCIVSFFNDFMNNPIFYIIISFCTIVVLPFVLFYIDCFNKINRFRIFLLIKAIIFNIRKMITSTKGEDFQIPFRFSAFPLILAGDYNDFISEISNIFKGDFNWTSISVNPCFK